MPIQPREDSAASRTLFFLWIYAQGFVYGAIGILALLTAFSVGDGTNTTTKMLQAIFQQPFGKILLGLIAFGLVG